MMYFPQRNLHVNMDGYYYFNMLSSIDLAVNEAISRTFTDDTSH